MTDEQWETRLSEAEAQCEDERQKVLEQGGLFVWVQNATKPAVLTTSFVVAAVARVIPVKSRFYLSLEDDLMRRFGGDRVKSFMSWANMAEDEPIEHA